MASPQDTHERTFFSLVRAWGLFRNTVDTQLQTYGISGAQLGVLRALHSAEKEGVACLSPGILSKRLIVQPPSITGVINRLERLGFVERVSATIDRRSKEIRLTPLGRGTLLRALEAHPAFMARVLNGFSPAESEELGVLMEKLSSHLRTLDSRTPSKSP